MVSTKKKFTTIDEYIRIYPEDIQIILERIRNAIKDAAPEAEEAISYQIPTFKLNGNLLHFAGFKNHIGFFPGAKAIVEFKGELSNYKTSKGTIQFPLIKKIPLGLIKKITKFRVKENKNKFKNKRENNE